LQIERTFYLSRSYVDNLRYKQIINRRYLQNKEPQIVALFIFSKQSKI